MTDIFSDLTWRGLIHQTTDDQHLPGWLNSGSRTLYAGFDPTADTLHVGSFVPIMTLRRFQKAGHRPIALVGGATGMIGDPSGKSEERNLLDREALARNVKGIENVLRRFLDFDGPNGAIIVNNYDWMSGFSLLDFLRDVGKHFPVNVMLGKDSVKSRLSGDTGISYTEFSYMLLQAYDFLHLKRQHNCDLQIGGSDQWGNITAGIDLTRRMVPGTQLYGLTCPLLLKSDGTKMGKTEKGALWLTADRTSPYAFFQYWVNLTDTDAGRALRVLTELPHDEIEALDISRASEPHLRKSQKRLAEWLTQLVHGDDGLAAAQRATEVFFGAAIEKLDDAALGEIFADVPSKEMPRSRLAGAGLPLIDALVEAELCKTKSEARRLIDGNGAAVNNRVRTGTDTALTESDLASQTILVLRSGKKKYALLKFVS